MDARGPEWCREHKDDLVRRILNNTTGRPVLATLVRLGSMWARRTLAHMIDEACRRAENRPDKSDVNRQALAAGSEAAGSEAERPQ